MAETKKNQEQSNQEKPSQKKSPQNQFIWVFLGIAAVLLIWLLSSWVYK